MKLQKRMLSLLLALAMVLSLCPGVWAAEATYSDVPETSWAYAYVEDVTAKGLMKGMGDNRFEPQQSMTRAMFVTVLARMSGETLFDNEPSVFPDVDTGRYYTGAVNWAAETGIVTGYPDGTFGTELPVTREQAATFLVRYASARGLLLEATQEPAAFTDADEVSHYAKAAVEGCSAAGILSGYPDGSFQPKKAITRAEAAKVLSVFLAVTGQEVPEPTVEPTEPTAEPTTEPTTAPTELPTEPSEPPTEPSEPAKLVTITFVGENGYAKYNGEKVTQIQVSTDEPYVEFAIYGQRDMGFELDEAAASAGKLNRAGDVFILSDFDEDVTVTYTTRYRTMYVTYVISPNYQNMYVETPQAVTWGQAIGEPETMRNGYHVEAWYLDPEYTQAYDFSTPVTEDITLYGQWTINVYTVTYMVDGGVYHTAQVAYNRYVTNPANPEKDGYVFNGWYLDEACTQPFTQNKDKIQEDTTLYAGWAEAKLDYVFLDGNAGNDANTGMTSADAVKTFAKAKELLEGSAHKVIRVVGQIKVTGTEIWDLSEYPGAMLLRDESYSKSYMFWVTGNLTLQNITIDGGASYWADGEEEPWVSYMVFNCTNGTVTMNEGTEIRNAVSTSSYAVGYLNGANLIINDGAKIHDNRGTSSGVFGATSAGASTIVMNGGEIYNNVAAGKATSATSSTPAGAFCLAGNSTKGSTVLTINGGKIYGNKAENAEGTFGCGVISMYNRVTFIMNGGEIFQNTGINVSAVMSSGAAVSKTGDINHVELRGGRIYDNTQTLDGTDLFLRPYTELALYSDTVLDGEILLQNSANRLPIAVHNALTRPLNLTCEAVVYNNVLLEGEDYALTEDDLAQVKLSNPLNSAYQLALDKEANHIYIGSTQKVGTAIYMSSAGSDTNDGLTKETAVATFAKAKELLAANQSSTGDNVIYIVAGTVSSTPKVIQLTEDQTWSLKGIPNAYVQVAEGTKGYMAYVTGATLTLEDITIDGNCFYNASNATALFRVTQESEADAPKGVLELKSGAVLRNCTDEAAYVYGGVVNMYEGSKLTGMTKDGAIYATGTFIASTGIDWTSTINVYGGEIVDNSTRCFNILGATQLNIYDGLFANNEISSTPGGCVIYGNSGLVVANIYGGTFKDNALTGTGSTSLGTVFYATQPCTLNVYGGTYTGNTCAKEPNANGFVCNPTKAESNAVITVKPGEKGLDLSNAPFYWSLAGEQSCLNVDGALTAPVKLFYNAAPASGQVVAKGTEGYTLTSADLAKLSCLNEGVSLTLDTANNRIIVAD